MKKFLFMMSIMLMSMIATSMAQMQASGLPEHDIGYVQKDMASLSLDCNAIVSFGQEWNIVDLQTPVVLSMEVSDMSAQVIEAYSIVKYNGEVSTTLVGFRWPNIRTEATNNRSYYTFTEPVRAVSNDSFMNSLTDHI